MNDSPAKLHAERVREAEDAWKETQRAAEAARTTANFAARAVRTFERENDQPLRRDAAHAGVERAIAHARLALKLEFLDMRGALCAPAAPASVSRLASLFAATNPAFAATLHELVDGDVPIGITPWSELDQAAYEAELASLRETAEQARIAAAVAGEAAQQAAHHRTAVDLGQA
jgi:hypothetical protein